MKAFFICLISIIVINLCSTRVISHSSGGSGDPIIAAIVIPCIAGFVIVVIVIIVCKIKCDKRKRMGVLPLSIDATLAEYNNPYAPPSYSQVPPYAQPPPYEYPPSYFASSAPTEPAKTIVNS
ncbi:unnamed protein product [Rotaria sp. Silwood1]|nr:unnamed protein product [Rotaria sp. Silwood1]